jgi:hypothetical protein
MNQFQAEEYRSTVGRNYWQWDYRDRQGKLHSGVAKSYEAAVSKAKEHGYDRA